tara:strand:+ start:20924 stop:21436 length:513 start_codon:yes stop_codon:yes gene_type:complete
MQHCIHCGLEIANNATFCSSCGKRQDEVNPSNNLDTVETVNRGNPTFLTTLCILTLVGSLIGIYRGLLYQTFASGSHFGNAEYIRGWLYVLVNLGTIIGAIVLLNKKSLGLYIYSVSQVLYLILIIWATSVYFGDKYTDQLALTISAFFFLPSLAFLIIYWTKPIRNNLQ